MHSKPPKPIATVTEKSFFATWLSRYLQKKSTAVGFLISGGGFNPMEFFHHPSRGMGRGVAPDLLQARNPSRHLRGGGLEFHLLRDRGHGLFGRILEVLR